MQHTYESSCINDADFMGVLMRTGAVDNALIVWLRFSNRLACESSINEKKNSCLHRVIKCGSFESYNFSRKPSPVSLCKQSFKIYFEKCSDNRGLSVDNVPTIKKVYSFERTTIWANFHRAPSAGQLETRNLSRECQLSGHSRCGNWGENRVSHLVANCEVWADVCLCFVVLYKIRYSWFFVLAINL